MWTWLVVVGALSALCTWHAGARAAARARPVPLLRRIVEAGAYSHDPACAEQRLLYALVFARDALMIAVLLFELIRRSEDALHTLARLFGPGS